MAKLIDITGRALSGEWGIDDETGDGVPVLRTTNFTNEGVVNYNDVITRTITKKNIDQKFLRKGDIIIEKSGGSDKFPVGRVIYFDGDENTYLFNNFTGLLRVKDKKIWNSKYVFYSLFANYRRGGTRAFENKTTGIHNLKTDDFVSRFDIYELPIKEQNLICEKLDKIYNIIKLRRQELLILDDLIKARFVEMFGDPIINSRHLETKNLQNVLMFKAGDFTAASDISDEPSETNPYPCYGGNGIRGYVSEYNQDGEYSLVGRQGALSGNVQFAVGKFKNTEHALLVTPIVEMNNTWLNHLLLNLDLKRYQTGAAQPGLSVKNLQEIQIICAPIDQQNQFADFVRQTDKSKSAKAMKEPNCHIIYYMLHFIQNDFNKNNLNEM